MADKLFKRIVVILLTVITSCCVYNTVIDIVSPDEISIYVEDVKKENH